MPDIVDYSNSDNNPIIARRQRRQRLAAIGALVAFAAGGALLVAYGKAHAATEHSPSEAVAAADVAPPRPLFGPMVARMIADAAPVYRI